MKRKVVLAKFGLFVNFYCKSFQIRGEENLLTDVSLLSTAVARTRIHMISN